MVWGRSRHFFGRSLNDECQFFFDSVPPPYCSRSGQNGGFTALILENTSTVPSIFLLLKSYNKNTCFSLCTSFYIDGSIVIYTGHCPMFIAFCTMYIVHCLLYNVQCSLFIVDFTIVHVGTVHAPIKHSPLIFCIVHSYHPI